MKALRIPEAGNIEVIDLVEPEPSYGEVKLKIQYVGLCGSDLNTFRGANAMAKRNVIPGHEVGAVIESVGDGCPDIFKPGLVVTVNPYTSCGVCSSCRNGRFNACQHNETLGVQRDGAMREYICLPWSKIIPVGEMSARDSALVEPMSVGFHAVARGNVTDNDVVVVIGCGMVGLGAVMRSVRRGATVIAVDLGLEKLEVARKAGAAYCIDSSTDDVRGRVLELTGGYGADVVIEAVGSPVTYVMAVDIVSFTGRVVCIGYSKSDVSFQTRLFVQKELDIRGSRNATPEDFRAVINCIRGSEVPLDTFVSGTVSPEQALGALQKWNSKPENVFRILVSFVK